MLFLLRFFKNNYLNQVNPSDESCLFPIQRSLKGKLGDLEVTFLVNYISISILLQCQKLESIITFFISIQTYITTTLSLFQRLLLMEVSVKVRHFMLGGINYYLKCKVILAVVT